MPAGRPSTYTPEIAAELCRRMAEEGQNLRQVCRADDMPGHTTVMQWCKVHPEFAAAYAHAREQLLEYWAEEINDISDDGRNDFMAANDPDNPGYRLNGEHIQRSKLRVDTRKWLLSKLAPKQYGDRLTHAGDPNAPLTVAVLDLSKPGG